MYLRETKRRNRDGSVVSYLQLAHSERHPVTGVPSAKVIHNFGRADTVDRDALARLVASISRFLEPEQAIAAATAGEVEVLEARRLGGAWVLDRLWERLGIGAALRRVAAGRRLDVDATERGIFAVVAQRALEPGSKLAATSWVAERVAIEGCAGFSEDAAYAAMDFLLDALGEIASEIFASVAHLLNLDVEIIFVDTTSTYWEVEVADELADLQPEPTADDGVSTAVQAGTRTFGKSKDHRDDLPQVVIGMAVTRTGIPVRVWCWPGATNDSALIRQVKDDMRDWTLSRIIWVADRGFASAENRRWLRRGDHHYIVGEKLRSGSAEATAAISRQGRYQDVAANLRVKEVRIGEGERFVICHNRQAAVRDAAVRERLLAQLEELIAGSDKLSRTKRAELRGVISTKPGLNRYLRLTPGGLLRVNAAAIKAETNLDGKYLLRSSDPKLSAEDIALGYKQLLEVERGWRDLKQVIDLRPVYHRKEQRIRAHVVLCWLALLLIRLAETSCGATWPTLRRELNRIAIGAFTGPAGTFRQRTEITKPQRDILAKLHLDPPPRIYQLTPADA